MSASDHDWQDRAACKDVDPEIFFPQRGRGKSAKAKRICEGCRVRPECLLDAFHDEYRPGVWGGMTEKERRTFIRAQRKGTSDTSNVEVFAAAAT